MQVEANHWPLAAADEGEAEQSIADFYPLQSKALYASTVGEFYHTNAESCAGNERIAQRDPGCSDNSIEAFGDLEIVDVDAGQALSERPWRGSLWPSSSSQTAVASFQWPS